MTKPQPATRLPVRVDRLGLGILVGLLLTGLLVEPVGGYLLGKLLTNTDDYVVPEGDGPTVGLLSQHRHLPKSATDIHVHFESDLDSEMEVRFDAPINDARAFLREMVGKDGESCPVNIDDQDFSVPLPDPRPTRSICGADSGIDTGRPSISVSIFPRGAAATVLVQTFTR